MLVNFNKQYTSTRQSFVEIMRAICKNISEGNVTPMTQHNTGKCFSKIKSKLNPLDPQVANRKLNFIFK